MTPPAITLIPAKFPASYISQSRIWGSKTSHTPLHTVILMPDSKAWSSQPKHLSKVQVWNVLHLDPFLFKTTLYIISWLQLAFSINYFSVWKNPQGHSSWRFFPFVLQDIESAIALVSFSQVRDVQYFLSVLNSLTYFAIAVIVSPFIWLKLLIFSHLHDSNILVLLSIIFLFNI